MGLSRSKGVSHSGRLNRSFQKNPQIDLDCGIHQWLHWNEPSSGHGMLAIMIQKNIQCRSQLIPKISILGTIRLFFDGDSEVEVEWWNSYQDRFL